MFTKKVELVRISEKDVPRFRLVSYRDGNRHWRQLDLDRYPTVVIVAEYRITYRLFGILLVAYTKILVG